MKLALTQFQRRLLYALFTVAAFVLALRQTLPVEALRERLVMEAAARGWQLKVSSVRPAGLVGVRLDGVALESRDGLRVPVERVDASLRLLPLFTGRRSLAFDARLFEGRVKGAVEARGTERRLAFSASGLDLARAAPLRQASGLDLAGVVRGEVDLTVDEKAPARSAGRVALAVDRAAVNGGTVPVPGMSAGLTLPRVGLGQVTAQGTAREGRFVFDRLDARGDDLEAVADGLYLQLGPRLAIAPIFGKVTLEVKDAFWARGGASGLKSLVELALSPGRTPDGRYALQLFGTLSRPQAKLGQ